MAERLTSEVQLARILEILPRAAGEDGVALADLAATLGTTERSLLRDLEEVYTRAYYHPAGSGEDVQVIIEAEKVAVWTTGEFRRPVRLNDREALALGLGLRIEASDAPASGRAELLALAERLETTLSSGESPVLLPHIAVGTGAASPEGVRALLGDAARERRRCRLWYLKPGAAEPEPRDVDPYVLLVTEGKWYVVGLCHRSAAVRVFRLDRVVEAGLLDEGFEVPADFDPEAYVSGGRVYRAGSDVEVAVRYSARIARWIAEQGPVETLDDGSVVVRYRVADSRWVVSHALQHGPDAEILSPPETREEVRAAVERIIG